MTTPERSVRRRNCYRRAPAARPKTDRRVHGHPRPANTLDGRPSRSYVSHTYPDCSTRPVIVLSNGNRTKTFSRVGSTIDVWSPRRGRQVRLAAPLIQDHMGFEDSNVSRVPAGMSARRTQRELSGRLDEYREASWWCIVLK